ncbi:glycosyltransferase [Flavobacteriaceae bacterium AU392]|nr:glycosyltransferase family 2 protein [Flavobacteriaceae bacterium]RKM82819.1 glycosyltransferase [Flavobacteriaceae bacterium AU392]
MTLSSPLISIIIPIFNRESIVKKTLDTIVAQTYTNWECIIIDDGSTDHTKQTMETYLQTDSRFKYFDRPNHLVRGANSCRNYGFTLAKGDYINWFDSDDIMQPNFLEEKVKAFQTNTDAVLHRNNYANYQITEYRTSKFDYNNERNLFYNYAMEAIEIQTCGFLWKRSFLEGKLLFDETIQRYQDNEFHIRMLALKPNIKVLDIVLATIRSGDGDKSQISSKTNITKKKLYDIFYYRYQCLKLASNKDLNVDTHFNKVIAKKAIWAFYAGLRFESKLLKRLTDVFKYYKKLRFVYSNNEISSFDIFKSNIYILKIIFFRK